MNVFDVIAGDGPILLGQPHGGTFVPGDLQTRLNATGRALADTDWHITRLYDGLLASATVVKSNIHRYVIDANRDPSGGSLYPGQNTTSLCPTTDFDGKDIWNEGQNPSADEIAERQERYHAPYHAALSEELDRIKSQHGCAILYDCHSIRSEIPFLFEGVLPVFNVGTNDGMTCTALLQEAVVCTCQATGPTYDTTLNGRFKGGWTTRHYGRPEAGVHAIQMELSQRAYMTEAAPWTYQPERADPLRQVLADILNQLDQHARARAI